MHKSERQIDGGKYAVLASVYAEDAQEGTKVNHDNVGGCRTKATCAGDFLYISVYPLIGFNANIQQRKRLDKFAEDREKSATIRAKYARYNNKRRTTELEQLVHANMTEGDLHICCTYAMQDYEVRNGIVHRTREDAKRDIYNYLRRIKRLLKKHGCHLNEFRWICVTVTKESIKEAVYPRPDTHHHHLLVHGVHAFLRKAIEDMWNYGYCHADRLQDSENGFTAIAAYIARQDGSANGENGGRRSFTTSKNIIRPRVTTSDSKISRRRVAMIAADLRVDGLAIFEKLYPDYNLVEPVRVEISNYVAGAYIYAKLRRKKPPASRQTPTRRRRHNRFNDLAW